MNSLQATKLFRRINILAKPLSETPVSSNPKKVLKVSKEPTFSLNQRRIPIIPAKPTYPEPYECCGSGCRFCVFDIYEKDLERWEKQQSKFNCDQS